jgi:hypothetical protein
LRIGVIGAGVSRSAVLGLSFKPDSDDSVTCRHWPSRRIWRQEPLSGCMIREHCCPNTLLGSMSVGNAPRVVVSGAAIVLHMTEWPQHSEIDPSELAAWPAFGN